jgi:hypothetical protein
MGAIAVLASGVVSGLETLLGKPAVAPRQEHKKEPGGFPDSFRIPAC